MTGDHDPALVCALAHIQKQQARCHTASDEEAVMKELILAVVTVTVLALGAAGVGVNVGPALLRLTAAQPAAECADPFDAEERCL